MYGESLATCPWSISTDWLRNEDLPVGAEAVGKLLLLAAVRAPFAVLALCSAKRNAAPVSGESMLANSARAASMVCGPSEGPPRGGKTYRTRQRDFPSTLFAQLFRRPDSQTVEVLGMSSTAATRADRRAKIATENCILKRMNKSLKRRVVSCGLCLQVMSKRER